MNFMGSDISEIVPREIPHIHVPSLLFRFFFVDKSAIDHKKAVISVISYLSYNETLISVITLSIFITFGQRYLSRQTRLLVNFLGF